MEKRGTGENIGRQRHQGTVQVLGLALSEGIGEAGKMEKRLEDDVIREIDSS